MSDPAKGLKLLLAQNHLDLIVNAVPHHGGRLLEYGCGGSTLEFARRLWPGSMLCTVEHDETWAKHVADGIDGTMSQCEVRIYLSEMVFPGAYNGTPREEEPIEGTDDYIHAPDGAAPFDVIFIDGVCRSDCLRHAKDILKQDGLVFLHDAERIWYDAALEGMATLGTAVSCGGYGHDRIKLWWGRPKR